MFRGGLMKALILLVISSMIFVGCGQMNSGQTTAGSALANLAENDVITENEANSLNNSDVSNENVELMETGSNSMMMKVGGVELLIDFVQEIIEDPKDIAMIINGVEVTAEVASDPESFQGLIASLVDSHLEGKEVLGIPLSELVDLGLGLISGEKEQADVSNLFGTLIRGALGMYLNNSPIGSIISAIVGPILGGENSGDQNNAQNNQNNASEGLSGIVETIGGLFGGGSSDNNNSGDRPFGGIFNLISNLFK
jgi:hypothetical protein